MRPLGGALGDQAWTERAGPVPVQIALATFGILTLELALIRWASSQVRAFAYFNNLVLIAAFLGMGLGLALGRRHAGLVHGTLPCLAALALALGLAEPLGLVHLSFPDASVHIWGAEFSGGGRTGSLLDLTVFGALIVGIVAVFLFAGGAVGCLFPRLEALQAYRWDLAGSLAGVLVGALGTAASAGPVLWLALGVLPFAWLSRRPLSLLAGLAVLALASHSAAGALFSPYNRIDLRAAPHGLRVEVNRDFHQDMHDLSDRALASSERPEESLKLRRAYELPAVINDQRRSALVVGAGTGNDVQAALRQGYARVVSVDIDPLIIDLGRRLHPERPYDDARVVTVVDDARAFFQRHPDRFDAVIYGLLDSHAMFSALSTLRLDNYVYTEEGIRSAWRHVAPAGHLSVSFSVFGGQWILDRLYWTIARATGQEPIAVYHGMLHGCTFIVPGPEAQLHLERTPFPRTRPSAPLSSVRTTSDDWPFLYVRPGVFPWGYLVVLSLLVLLAAVSTPLAFGARALGADFDPVLFLMGAGFLLIETRGVTALSLLFGSTWLVNAAVFSGILVMALLANEAVVRRRPRRLRPWFVGLLASVLFLWLLPPATLTGLPMLARGVLGGLVNGVPLGFAGVIVSILLARSRNAAAALGSNLLGTVVGGCLEYLSMLVGLGSLALLALGLYVAAWLAEVRRGAQST
jgi:SAM-dependent methyltransferase